MQTNVLTFPPKVVRVQRRRTTYTLDYLAFAVAYAFFCGAAIGVLV